MRFNGASGASGPRSLALSIQAAARHPTPGITRRDEPQLQPNLAHESYAISRSDACNTTGSAISLTGRKIVDDAGTQTYNLSGTIAANGYFLIERSATSVAGGLVVSGMSLANTGGTLELQNSSGARVDIVNAAGGVWFAGTIAGYYTTERKTAGGGDAASNWAHNNGVTRNGTNPGGRAINGTPRAKNSATP